MFDVCLRVLGFLNALLVSKWLYVADDDVDVGSDVRVMHLGVAIMTVKCDFSDWVTRATISQSTQPGTHGTSWIISNALCYICGIWPGVSSRTNKIEVSAMSLADILFIRWRQLSSRSCIDLACDWHETVSSISDFSLTPMLKADRCERVQLGNRFSINVRDV